MRVNVDTIMVRGIEGKLSLDSRDAISDERDASVDD
jgi:hypothetical protein